MQTVSLQNLQMANANSYPKEGEGGRNKDMKKNKNIAQFNQS